MTDAEKRLRAWCMKHAPGISGGGGNEGLRLLTIVLEEHMTSARDAALEEAAHWFEDSDPGTEWDAKAAASEMRALQAQPSAVVPAERVREAMDAAHLSPLQRKEMCTAIGVDLDATPATEHVHDCRVDDDCDTDCDVSGPHQCDAPHPDTSEDDVMCGNCGDPLSAHTSEGRRHEDVMGFDEEMCDGFVPIVTE